VLVLALGAVALGAPRGETAAAQSQLVQTQVSAQNSLVDVSITVQGRVSAFTKATGTSNGSITIAGVKYAIRAGIPLCECIKVGAEVRLRLHLDLNGLISGCTVEWVRVTLSGLVSAYTHATASSNGSITIGGHTYSIKAGVSLPLCVRVGVYVSLKLVFNGSGQVTGCSFIKAYVTLSGLVTAYVRATATSNGSITVGGKTLVIKAGTSLPLCVQVGAQLKLRLDLSASGLVRGCSVLEIVSGKVTLDGLVTALVRPTATTGGSITIGGIKLRLKAGLVLPAAISVGVKARVNVDVSDGTVRGCQFLSASITVAGLVSAYVKATATTNGSITIAGKKIIIKAGVALPAAIKIGVRAKLALTLDSTGHVTRCSFVSASVYVAGLLSLYNPTTLTSNGRLTVDGASFVIKAGTKLPLLLSIGLFVKLTLKLNSSGQVIGCSC
jgi:hypothetical protein